ncbi:hypothetical protein SLA2020_253480 [Shorea laevis]
MGPRAFLQFCDIREREGGLQPTRRATIEEQVAKTLYILVKNAKNRSIQFWFRRFGETTSRHFHSVLRAIIAVEEKFIKQPDGSQIPVEIMSSSRFYPYFKDCVGAIDGTHIRVKISPLDAPKYRGRKEHAALHNAIERAFGVLKRAFGVLRGETESFYGVRTQNLIILACCIIHNFLMGVDPDEDLIAEVDMELRNQENLQQTRTSREEEEDANRGEMLRDVIAADMWHNYKNC